jgi:hypothetical protein
VDPSPGTRYRRSLQSGLNRWVSKSPWRRVYLGTGMTLISVLFVVTPGTFVTPKNNRTIVLVAGWAGALFFGAVTLFLAVQALRSPRQ